MRCKFSFDHLMVGPSISPRSAFLRKGFTLVELLVAISILAVVAVLGWRGLDSIVRARTALTDNLERTRGLQLAFAQLQNDCAHLAPSGILANRVSLRTDGQMLTLVRNVFADNQPSRVQVVTYQVNDGVLTRWESVATRDLDDLDRSMQLVRDAATVSQRVALQSGVGAMTLRIWNNGWLSGGSTSAAQADPAIGPTGLEVTLQLQGRDESLHKIFLLGAA